MVSGKHKKGRSNAIQNLWHEYQWTVIGLFGLVAAILGFIGYQKYSLTIGRQLSIWDSIYFTLQLFALEFDHTGKLPWELQVSRFLAPSVIVYTALKAIFVIFRDQFQLFRMRFVRDHVVICGLDKMGVLLASTFCDQGYRVVCLNLGNTNAGIDHLRNHGAIVLTGHTSSSKLLRKARVDRASYLISANEDDGINADIAVHARKLVKHRTRGVLNCFIHISDPELVALLKEKEIETQQSDAVRINYFNIYNSGARALLQTFPAFDDETSEHHHLLLVGLGQPGEGLLLRVAWLWNTSSKHGNKLQVTLIDSNAESKYVRLAAQYPHLSELCEIKAIEMTIPSAEFQQGSYLRNSNDRNKITKIYICLNNDSDGLLAALTLRQHMRDEKIPVIVCMKHKTGLATLLQGNTGRDYEGIDAFGLLEQTCQPDLLLGGTHEMLARAIHHDYVCKEKEKGETANTNPSIVAWDDLPETLKNSNRRQSDHIGEKLKLAGYDIRPLSDWNATLFKFSDTEIESLAELEHARWNEERFHDGWRYAPGEKNTDKKTSPWLVGWDKLPDEIKEYDRNTVRELPAFLAKAGFEVFNIKKG